MAEQKEKEKTDTSPEEKVSNLAYGIEIKDAKDPIIGSEQAKIFKEFIKSNAVNLYQSERDGLRRVSEKATFVSGVGLRMCKSIYNFIKNAVVNRGKVSFSEGMKIGQEIFDPSDNNK